MLYQIIFFTNKQLLTNSTQCKLPSLALRYRTIVLREASRAPQGAKGGISTESAKVGRRASATDRQRSLPALPRTGCRKPRFSCHWDEFTTPGDLMRRAMVGLALVLLSAGCAIRYDATGVSRVGVGLWGFGDPPGVNWNLDWPRRDVPELPASARPELPPRRIAPWQTRDMSPPGRPANTGRTKVSARRAAPRANTGARSAKVLQ